MYNLNTYCTKSAFCEVVIYEVPKCKFTYIIYLFLNLRTILEISNKQTSPNNPIMIKSSNFAKKNICVVSFEISSIINFACLYSNIQELAWLYSKPSEPPLVIFLIIFLVFSNFPILRYFFLCYNFLEPISPQRYMFGLYLFLN